MPIYSSGEKHPLTGDLVIIVNHPDFDREYPNKWEGDRLVELATHSLIESQIKSAIDSGHQRIWIQISSKSSPDGERYLIGSCIPGKIHTSRGFVWVSLTDWEPTDSREFGGRSYGAAYYIAQTKRAS